MIFMFYQINKIFLKLKLEFLLSSTVEKRFITSYSVQAYQNVEHSFSTLYIYVGFARCNCYLVLIIIFCVVNVYLIFFFKLTI